ncbi:hypothetical protein AB0425_41700 [Actinosynnema sp. NPDC051121]
MPHVALEVVDAMPDDELTSVAANPVLLPRAVIRILMVTDDRGSYDPQFPFSLNELVRVLREGTDEAEFRVKKAHRGADRYANGADIKSFRFDSEDVDLVADYDELWLFGVDRTKSALADLEVQVISEFMQNGGGVFATGDHENMGWALCGRLPRVRSMRKWSWAEPGPNRPAENPDDPYAPPEKDRNRHDTMQRRHEDGIRFALDDQSDDIPQVISPRYYAIGGRSVVHPLLSIGSGIITTFPDHPHEGECYVPKNLDRKFRIGEVEHHEYPARTQPRTVPEIVAWSSSGSRPAERDEKGILDATTFGAVGAYDGHLQEVGRVVVDATWHHFFDINLLGDRVNKNPEKRKGFSASAEGRWAYERIKVYFRNIASWVAPPTGQRELWWRALWAVRWHHQVGMGLRTEFYDNPEGLSLEHLRMIGHSALMAYPDAIFRLWAGREGLGRIFPGFWNTLGSQIDPWLTTTDTGPDPLPSELVLETFLGAMVYGVAATYPELTDDAVVQAVDADWAQQAGAFLERSLSLLVAHVQQTAAGLATYTSALTLAQGTQE